MCGWRIASGFFPLSFARNSEVHVMCEDYCVFDPKAATDGTDEDNTCYRNLSFEKEGSGSSGGGGGSSSFAAHFRGYNRRVVQRRVVADAASCAIWKQ